jgi:uncharacterized protein YbjT (DUF2867 family)
MIVVTGATGTIGTLVVRLLISRGIDARVMARDPAKARSLFGPDAQVVAGDFTDASSLERAFNGANAVFVLSSPAQAIPANDAAALAAARRSGVARAVKMSSLGVDEPASVNLASTRWHGPGEAALRASGLEFTILRPAGFDSNALAWRASILAGTPIEIMTGPGKHPFVDPRDVAEVAVHALTRDALVNRTLTLTGPEALTARQQLDFIERVIGRSISSVDLSLETFAERMRSRGIPDDVVASATAGQAFVRGGGSSTVFADLPQALGRPARSFAEWAEAHATAFR